MIKSCATISLVPSLKGGPWIYWDSLEDSCAKAAVDEVAFTGRVVYIGYAKAPVEYETRYFVQKELDILGSRNCLGDFPGVIEVLKSGKFPVDDVISREVSLDDADQTAGIDFRRSFGLGQGKPLHPRAEAREDIGGETDRRPDLRRHAVEKDPLGHGDPRSADLALQVHRPAAPHGPVDQRGVRHRSGDRARTSTASANASIPFAADLQYDFPELGAYLGKVGLTNYCNASVTKSC